MKILIFSQYYFPEGVPKPSELAESLIKRGHDVSVVTGFPHYPGGKLFVGYKLSVYKNEVINEIPILRCFEYPYHGAKPLLRMLNYLSFMISSPFAAFFTPKCDVIYVYHPPLTVGVAVWIFAKIKGIPFVYDVQDIWPDFVVWSGMMKEGRIVQYLRKLEKFVYGKAKHIIVGTKTAKLNLIEKNVEDEKISVLPHWIDEELFNDSSITDDEKIREQLGWNEKFVFLFAGNLGIVQGLETIIEAAEILKDTDNIRIAFVGDGTDKDRLVKYATEKKLANLEFLDRRPLEKMPELMSASNVLLVHLKDSGMSQYVIPSKIMAYLASGKPILVAMNGIAADLVETAEAGFVVVPENPKLLADEMLRISKIKSTELAEIGENGKAYLKANLTKETAITQYEELLVRIGNNN
jgi:colanic acid biosynthesis glycosyl transferase WcaI